MTSQLISRPSKEQESASRSQTQASNNDGNLSKLMQSYQADRLVKYLHLQAEVEVLLQKVKALGSRL
jgi:hypothetical protein